jgi:hypothetical protein
MFRRLVLLLLFPAYLQADSITFVVTESVLDVYPDFKARMTQLLDPLEHDVTIEVLPGERAYKQLLAGHVAGDLFRSASITHESLPLIVVEPPIVSLSFHMIVSSQTPEQCTSTKSELIEYSVGGISRAKVNQQSVFPLFKSGHEFDSIEHAEKMMVADRVDVLVWPLSAELEENLPATLFLCREEAIADFKVYTLLHESYEWLLPELEALYKAVY